MTDVRVSSLGTDGEAASVLVNDTILLEAPPTALYHLQRMGRDVADLRVVFISGLDGDRTAGLAFLIAERASRAPQRTLWIVGPPGVARHATAQLRMAFPGDSLGILARANVKWEEVGAAYSRNRTVAYDAIPLRGAAAYGYRFIANGQVVSYTPRPGRGERSPLPEPSRLAETADVFIRAAA